MTGKSKCKILKDIRRQIARDNDIEFVTSECKYQGECSGTCPKCEAELRYLEDELAKRQRAGKAVAVAGIAAAFMLSTAACTPPVTLQGAPLPDNQQGTDPSSYSGVLMGDPTVAQGETTEPLDGEIIMGDLRPEE